MPPMLLGLSHPAVHLLPQRMRHYTSHSQDVGEGFCNDICLQQTVLSYVAYSHIIGRACMTEWGNTHA